LAHPRHGGREPPVGGVEVDLPEGFSDGRVNGKWKRGLAREIGIGLIGKEIPIGERWRDLFEDRPSFRPVGVIPRYRGSGEGSGRSSPSA
jgi:hypothetical protein